ncbi:dTMP kinase [Bacillus clarus]|uniref:Thymidylate kinase n=1 Tax=Bacillus clarus TaxID=2338372 RepID=A0A090ZCK5_9BACI|nr:dTMP kinase [Bacillus clarus]KFN02011.1 thymidylate kinase [Bacillus clarus]RFT64900.1 dTMP kinase [Bacillus clarus]
MRGKFIVLEGLSGAGKSTTANKLIDNFTKNGVEAVYHHGACTDSEFGKNLKKMMVNNSFNNKQSALVTPFFIADILQDSINTIKPLLDKGVYVIQDRYTDSIISYNNFSGIVNDELVDIQPIFELYHSLGLILQPDITILCQVKEKTLIDRLIERKNIGKLTSVHQQYLDNPDYINLHQEQFIKLLNDSNGKYSIVETDNFSCYETIDKISIQLLD